MTIRQIYELLKADNEEYLDAELLISIRGNGTVQGHATTARDLWGFPRSPSVPQTGEKARVTMDVYLNDNYRILKAKNAQR